jgi:hypothetical protein
MKLLEIETPSKNYIVCTECKQMSNKNVKFSKNKMCPECNLGQLV